MTTSDLHPSTTESTLERECALMGVQLKPCGPTLSELFANMRVGARLCQPWGEPDILVRDDLSVEQRAQHVRYLLAKLREPWAGAALIQDPALALDSPEFR